MSISSDFLYTLVNGGIQGLTHQKQQKKIIKK